jgi:hypothetical protein
MINYRESDGQSLIHLINMIQRDELIGAEIGMWTAQTFCTLLDNCPRIKTLYGIDPYKPYVDTIDGESMVVDSDMIMQVKIQALTNIMSTGKQEKVLFVEDYSVNALDLIPDHELDFIFVDSYINKDHALDELKNWYPKVKSGGIFSGHDYDCIKETVDQFRKINNIKQNISVFDNTFVWIK